MKAVKLDLGKVSITVHGKWENIDYNKLCLVYHEGKNASYISKRPVPINTPISDTKYWTMLVQGGNTEVTINAGYTKDEVDILLTQLIEEVNNKLKLIGTDISSLNRTVSLINNKIEELENKVNNIPSNPGGNPGSGSDIDLSDYVTKTYLGEELSKYAKIENIPEIPTFKTINGHSIVGTGNIEIVGGSGGETIITDIYSPILDENTKITTNIGSIEEGSSLKDLSGKSYSEIIDAMLVKEVWTDPKYVHTISLSIANTLVKVGSNVVDPTIAAQWNDNIQSSSDKTITNTLTKTILGSSQTVYNKSGNSTFNLAYSYPEGYYDITSNLGKTKRITVPAKSDNIIKIVTATYPWFINTTEQALVAIGSSKTIEINLTGSPSIKVPFINSTVKIQADLGFGWMDVDWNVTTDNNNLGGAIDETVPYKIYSKPDSYASSVKHKITINLSK